MVDNTLLHFTSYHCLLLVGSSVKEDWKAKRLHLRLGPELPTWTGWWEWVGEQELSGKASKLLEPGVRADRGGVGASSLALSPGIDGILSVSHVSLAPLALSFHPFPCMGSAPFSVPTR